MQYRILRDQWFLVGILITTMIALIAPHPFVEAIVRGLTQYHANEFGIALIFILSGLELQWEHILDATRDWAGTCLALATIFILAPLLAWLLSHATFSNEIRIGLLLVGVVPTTLVSGVVMSSASGGRIAHALFLTLLANLFSAVTIPSQLALMIPKENIEVSLPYLQTIAKLVGLVLLPLGAGILLHKPLAPKLVLLPFHLNIFSRCIILIIIFLGLCKGRDNILGSGKQVITALGLVTLFHLLLAAILWMIMRSLRWGSGRRESIFFMGIQKTLPLSIWLQATYFTAYGMALVVCILHHIVQLIVDSYFVGRLATISRKEILSHSPIP